MKKEESIIRQLNPDQIRNLVLLIRKETQDAGKFYGNMKQKARIEKNLSGPRGPVHRKPTPKKGSKVLSKAQIEYWKHYAQDTYF